MTPTVTTTQLVARTEVLDVEPESLDLVGIAGARGVLFRRDGFALAGRGEAVRVAPSDAAETLRAIARDGEGPAPIAIGALPFASDGAAGSLLVPADAVVVRDGRAFRVTVAPADALGPDPLVAERRAEQRSPSDFQLHASPDHDSWTAAITGALAAIDGGEVRKVVLARSVVVTADGPLVVTDILRRLVALFPSCTTFSVDGFVGASPELLVRRTGAEVRCQPLAGTVARSGDPDTDARLAAALMASAKDRREHAFVVDAVVHALARVCDDVDAPAEPTVVPLRNVAHLATPIRGRLSGPTAGRPSALALATMLHPTPAVAGTPTDAALRVIERLERESRGRYAGPVGWVDADGDGEWVVGIRSAEIDGNRARLMSGVGVVAGSDPEAELAETQLKLQALLAAIVRP
ncbi:MAG: Isochorismate synthase [Acidimicrobiales bacterium]|nr:Isochorismate synthase [Acidimicrobiales bacterium]